MRRRDREGIERESGAVGAAVEVGVPRAARRRVREVARLKPRRWLRACSCRRVATGGKSNITVIQPKTIASSSAPFGGRWMKTSWIKSWGVPLAHRGGVQLAHKVRVQRAHSKECLRRKRTSQKTNKRLELTHVNKRRQYPKGGA